MTSGRIIQISNRFQHLIDLARIQSTKCDMDFRLCSLILPHGSKKPMYLGTNTNMRQRFCHSSVPSLHSEMSALSKLGPSLGSLNRSAHHIANVNPNKIGKIKPKCQHVSERNRSRRKTKQVDLFVCRFSADLTPKFSRPCNLCISMFRAMVNVKIIKIYFFDELGNLCCEKLQNMEAKCVSFGLKLMKQFQA